LLRPESGEKNRFFRAFNTAFDKLSNGYASAVKTLSRVWVLVALVFAGLCALALVLFESTPTAFVPAEDQGYVMVLAKLPSAATIQRTEVLVEQLTPIVMKTPGVADVIAVPGYNLIDAIQDPSAAFLFVMFKPYDERKTPDTQLEAIMKHI
jgi:gold/copper resistance efflux pump